MVQEILNGHDQTHGENIHMEKISRQTFTDIFNLPCDLDLQCSNPILKQDTAAYDAVLTTKFGCKPTSNLEDTTEIVLFWVYKPKLWPWHWTQWTNFSAWHSGLWSCITIPGLVTNCPVVQKISSGETLTNILNLCCDLDLQHNNSIFPQDTPAYDAVLSNQVWLQTYQLFRR